MLRSRGWLSASLLALCLSHAPLGAAYRVLEEQTTDPLQLGQKSFEPTIRALNPDQGILMEFYAHW